MQKVDVIWEDAKYGHLHVYVALDGYGETVVVFVEPRNLTIVETHPYDEFVEKLPEALRDPFEKARRQLVEGRMPPPWKRAPAIAR